MAWQNTEGEKINPESAEEQPHVSKGDGSVNPDHGKSAQEEFVRNLTEGNE